MARREPLLDPNGYFHVSARGVYGRPLFRATEEYELFLHLYGRWSTKYRWRTLAWTLLDNHHHFLVHLEDGDLTKGMRVLHAGFSRRMNEKYDETRKGHLVRHCFYAGALETTESILAVARYIDLNPVRAGLCDEAMDWPWSSFAANTGRSHNRPFHVPGELLKLVAETPAQARAAYRRFVREGLDESGRDQSSDEGYVVESAA
jgi:REP element-mobilizing transposase RayT